MTERTFMRTDLGNAERLVHHHGSSLRYCHPFRKWYCWDGQRWRPDDSGAPGRFAKLTVREIYNEAAAAASEDDRKALAAWAAKSESNSAIQAMLARASVEADLVILPDWLDTDPWLLCVNNGVLDLKAGELRPHDRDDLISKLAPVDYDPDAQAPTWTKFLQRIMDDDDELVSFLQRAAGYSLTGQSGEHCFFIPYGIGRNGKSTFLNAIHAMLGDYAQQLPRDTLLRRRGENIPNDIARLAGARFATAIETRQGQKLDEEVVKQITGGDKITARFLHAEWFDFHPVAKIFLATNAKPKIEGTDDGIWSRVRLIPFTVTIPEQERDQHLGAKLEAELPGILAWAVKGCLDWQTKGLDPPKAVTEATDEYRKEEDVLADFIAQCCIEAQGAYAYASDLHEAYQEFTGQRISAQAFGRMLGARGYDSSRTKNRRMWLGIGLATTDDQRPQGDG